LSFVTAPPEEMAMAASRRTPLAWIAFAFCAISSHAFAAEPLKVVVSFSILGDLVTQVGGDHVVVRTLVGPNGDAHVYEPTPADARDTAAAGLVVVNGLGFEGWLDRLVGASGYSGPVAVASKGVTPISLSKEAASGMPVEGEGEEAEHHHGNVDPHAWQSVANVTIYVKNIVAALCSADNDDCTDYRANGTAYLAKLTALDSWVKSGVAAIPAEKRKVITTHDAFGYFAHEYGVTFLAPQGVSTESEASAGDVARLIDQIRNEGVTALFVENISDPRLIQQIAAETGIAPGGELYSDALSEPGGPAATYIEMMWHNAGLLQSAMLGS
jgi:zinc/manganese transport system substrate-binding protein